MSVTLADVARRAGVSPATASRALGGRPHVAPATRLRVHRAADELQFVVSPEASRLAGGSGGRVGVVVPHLAQWSCGAVLEGLEPVLRGAGVDVLLYGVGDAAARTAFFADLPARRRVDALVVLGTALDEHERGRLELMAVPVVAAAATGRQPGVHVDEHAAARHAVDHLLHLGHRRIGAVAAAGPLDGVLDGALEAFAAAHREALRGAGFPHEDLLVRVGRGASGAAEGAGRLLGLREPPTAVVASSDEVALGVVRTLGRARLRVPDDVSVVGLGDHPLAEAADLTTVCRPVREQGAEAARMVLAALVDGAVPPSVVLPSRLVVRGSTAPPRSA
ncbi:LacI family DNA-binding transcriptional regulator [Pseudonocardia broussonetiae]|uniref:LacI family DNA-binding transcriptional regulator n=1 Tax=Pseudonocardia broussonetiae TaxID=2736640 RepID=A0A6M6JMK0_9PSEU|nr:LacI family DNA-binding transcriptional regulator [Pseudonocardia broussonetiae]QJY48433.1 LacI family DNA-binding transcriptional regulator [Pseudonocardia broussonetiae]